MIQSFAKPGSVVQPRIDIIGRQDAPVLTADHIEVRMGLNSLSLCLGVVTESVEHKVTVKAQAHLLISPGHAKKLVEILAQHVGAYEGMFGPIQTQPINLAGGSQTCQ
jgi:hypothetical protein